MLYPRALNGLMPPLVLQVSQRPYSIVNLSDSTTHTLHDRAFTLTFQNDRETSQCPHTSGTPKIFNISLSFTTPQIFQGPHSTVIRQSSQCAHSTMLAKGSHCQTSTVPNQGSHCQRTALTPEGLQCPSILSVPMSELLQATLHCDTQSTYCTQSSMTF